MSYTIEARTPQKVRVTQDTYFFDMAYDNYTAMVTNPISSVGAGEELEVVAVCHHSIGYDYYLTDPNGRSGIDVNVCEAIPEAPPAPALPDKPLFDHSTVDGIAYRALPHPKKLFVTNATGAEKCDFSSVTTLRDLRPVSTDQYGAAVTVIGTASLFIPPSTETLYMTPDDWGEFQRTGRVARQLGYKEDDLGDSKPPAVLPKIQVPTLVHDIQPIRPIITETFVDATKYTPDTMRFQWLNDQHEPVKYQVMQRVIVRDYSNKGKAAELHKGKIVAVYGTFSDNGKTLLMLKLDNPQIKMFDYWYGISEHSSDGKRNIEELPDMSDVRSVATTPEERQYLRQVTNKDRLLLTTNHLAKSTTKVFDIFKKKGSAK